MRIDAEDHKLSVTHTHREEPERRHSDYSKKTLAERFCDAALRAGKLGCGKAVT